MRSAMKNPFLPRQAPIVWSNKELPQKARALQEYEESGFIFIPQFIPQKKIDFIKYYTQKMEDEDLYGKILEPNIQPPTIRSQFNFHQYSEDLIPSLYSTYLKKYITQILGEDNYIHQCHVNYKKKMNGGEYSWHSDYTFWYWQDGMIKPRAVSIIIFLSHNNLKNGCLRVLPGSHKLIYQKEWLNKNKDTAALVERIFNRHYKTGE